MKRKMLFINDEPSILQGLQRLFHHMRDLWGLPHNIVEASVFHKTPHQCPSTVFDVLGAVHVINAPVHHFAGGSEAANSLSDMDHGYLAKTGMADCLDRRQIWRKRPPECRYRHTSDWIVRSKGHKEDNYRRAHGGT